MHVDSDGRFEVTLTGFGARRLLFGADGFVGAGTVVYADGSDVELEVRLGTEDRQSHVSYEGPLNDTRRLGELQDGGALCIDECPPPARIRAMIEGELARAQSTEVRIALWMAYLTARKHLPEVHARDEEFARQLLAALEPTSWRWVENASALVVATRVTGDRHYFMRAFAEHPDPNMPLELVWSARAIAREAGEQDEVERLNQLAEHPRVTASERLPFYEQIGRLQRPAEHGPQPGDKVPDFAVTTIDGERIDADHLPGKLTLIHFWSTWCKSCKYDLPLVHELIASHGDAGFAIVSFTETDEPATVEQFRADHWPMPWHHVVMPSGQEAEQLKSAFDLAVVPTWYLVDENRQIVLTNHHPADSNAKARRDALREYLEDHLQAAAGE